MSGCISTSPTTARACPPACRARLFQPFGAGSPGGSGLGLAVARDLARGHGGELELLRTGPEGATFRLSLPAGPG